MCSLKGTTKIGGVGCGGGVVVGDVMHKMVSRGKSKKF